MHQDFRDIQALHLCNVANLQVILSGSDCRLLSTSDKCLSNHTLKEIPSQQSDVLNRPDGTISQQGDVLSVNGAPNTTEQLLRSEERNPKSKAYEIAVTTEQDDKKTKTKEEKDKEKQDEKKAKSTQLGLLLVLATFC